MSRTKEMIKKESSFKKKISNSETLKSLLNSANVKKKIINKEIMKKNDNLFHLLTNRNVKSKSERDVIMINKIITRREIQEKVQRNNSKEIEIPYKNSKLVSPIKISRPILITDSLLDTNDYSVNNTQTKNNILWTETKTSKMNFSSLARKIKLTKEDKAFRFFSSVNDSLESFEKNLMSPKISNSILTTEKYFNDSKIKTGDSNFDKMKKKLFNLSKVKSSNSRENLETDPSQVENIEDLHFNMIHFYHQNKKLALEMERRSSIAFYYEFDKSQFKFKKDTDKILSVRVLEKEVDL